MKRFHLLFSQGAAGDEGDSGEKGTSGAKGERGAKGDRGHKGPTGPQVCYNVCVVHMSACTCGVYCPVCVCTQVHSFTVCNPYLCRVPRDLLDCLE